MKPHKWGLIIVPHFAQHAFITSLTASSGYRVGIVSFDQSGGVCILCVDVKSNRKSSTLSHHNYVY
jgi:hypothetical protein